METVGQKLLELEMVHCAPVLCEVDVISSKNRMFFWWMGEIFQFTQIPCSKQIAVESGPSSKSPIENGGFQLPCYSTQRVQVPASLVYL